MWSGPVLLSSGQLLLSLPSSATTCGLSHVKRLLLRVDVFTADDVLCDRTHFFGYLPPLGFGLSVLSGYQHTGFTKSTTFVTSLSHIAWMQAPESLDRYASSTIGCPRCWPGFLFTKAHVVVVTTFDLSIPLPLSIGWPEKGGGGLLRIWVPWRIYKPSEKASAHAEMLKLSACVFFMVSSLRLRWSSMSHLNQFPTSVTLPGLNLLQPHRLAMHPASSKARGAYNCIWSWAKGIKGPCLTSL